MSKFAKQKSTGVQRFYALENTHCFNFETQQRFAWVQVKRWLSSFHFVAVENISIVFNVQSQTGRWSATEW